MNKYPKRPVDEHDNPHDDISAGEYSAGHKFRCGSAFRHVKYLIEMSRRHPIMYWIWYRWWIPSLLHADERKKLDNFTLEHEFRPYWADFALYHPVQFLVFLFLRQVFQAFVKPLTSFVKIVGTHRLWKFHVAKDGTDDMLIKDKLVE